MKEWMILHWNEIYALLGFILMNLLFSEKKLTDWEMSSDVFWLFYYLWSYAVVVLYFTIAYQFLLWESIQIFLLLVISVVYVIAVTYDPEKDGVW